VKSLETELASWVLRQPSAKVKERLFGASAPTRERSADAGRSSFPLWSLLAPAAVCLFVAVAAFNQRESLFPADSGPMMGTLVASNQNVVISSSNTFDWTNHPDLPSSVRSQLVSGTNK